MEPTLHDKENMIVTKIGEPQRFDIIVFHAPNNTDYIKRVIGLPGDSIEYKDDILYINGEPFDEPYLDEANEDGFSIVAMWNWERKKIFYIIKA